MKTSATLFSLLLSLSIFAQLPQAIKYQAVARNEGGQILANQQISIRVSIIDSASGGQAVFTEIHKEGTNPFGLFTIEIGRGLVPTGNFQNINWPTGDKWLKIELDPNGGNSYSLMGISEMVSVPYAFYAGSAVSVVEDSTDELQTLSISGNVLSISNGNTVTLPNGTDTDDQNLSLSGTTLSIEDGNSVDLSILQDGVNDADSDPTNELQTLSLTGDTLSIGNGNSVILQTTGNDDHWIANGNDIYNANTGSIGVGTATPDATAEFDISSTTKGFLTPRMTTTQRLAINNPAMGLEVFDITAKVKMYYNGQRWLEVGADPIGTIQAFHKSFTGTPTLPWGWKECNGQTLTDTESPYNGSDLPDLNATFTAEGGSASSAGRFLRGGTTSGVVTADQTNNIAEISSNGSNGCGVCTSAIPQNGGWPTSPPGYDRNNSNTSMRVRHRAVETYPGNMTVVWVIRVK